MPRYDPSVYEQHLITVTYPGFAASRSQMSKYTGPDGVLVLGNECNRAKNATLASSPSRADSRASTKHDANTPFAAASVAAARLVSDEDRATLGFLYHATCRRAPRLIYNVLPSPEVHELVTGQCSCHPVDWITMLKSRGSAWYFGIDGCPTSYMKLREVNMAGHVDQAACLREVERAVRCLRRDAVDLDDEDGASDDDGGSDAKRRKRRSTPKNAKRKLVLMGCSRGASTMLYTALRLPRELAEHVGLVILEAPFSTLEDVVRESSWFPNLAMGAIRALGNYQGSEPYELPASTHLSCPLAFVTSAKDARVPEVCTLRAMKRVAEAFPQIRIEHLRLKHSPHASMPLHHPDDVAAYDEFVHRLYQQHIIAPQLATVA